MAVLNSLLCVAEGLSTGPLIRPCQPHTHPDCWSFGWKELYPRCLPGPIWPAFTLYVHYMTALWFHPTVGLPWKWTQGGARSRILSACLYVSEKGQTQTPWLRLLCWCKSFDTALMRGSALQLACSDGVQGSMNQKKWTYGVKNKLFDKWNYCSSMISKKLLKPQFMLQWCVNGSRRQDFLMLLLFD